MPDAGVSNVIQPGNSETVHGHPGGSQAGAAAARAAVEAVASGQPLDAAARTSPELRVALDLWSATSF